MFSVINAAKLCFNSITRVALLDSAVSSTKAYSVVSSTSILRSFAPYEKNGQLSNTPCTLIGAEKLNLSSNFSSFSISNKLFAERSLLKVGETCNNTTRTVTKFTLSKGKKRSVRAVVKRFYRLDNGLWIRRIGGYHRKVHLQSKEEKFRLRQHIVCARYQCEMLDKMVTDHWKKPKYFIDDPYEPYQVRHNIDYVTPFKKMLRRRRR